MMFDKIKHLVYTPELSGSTLVRSAKAHGVDCIPVLDARSAVYAAVGITEQSREMAAVCLDAGNASRSAFSGMTEAYYRSLPIVLITVGRKLDYSRALKDAANGHYVVQTLEQMDALLDRKLPIHVEWETAGAEASPCPGETVYQLFRRVLDERDYLYIGPGVCPPEQTLPCRVVSGGMSGCMDGGISNVLGASLARKHKRYIGLLSEQEFTHDMNTLGNIHVSDALMFVVIVQRETPVLENYGKALGFEVCTARENEMEPVVEHLLYNGKKSVLFVKQEG